ncbi:hypothetical protein HDU98_012348 [Podochytrium sp. JEL0797]|nr:hypothetical protein HDU98_012348 [Podochytrium sp. JEL0797]
MLKLKASLDNFKQKLKLKKRSSNVAVPAVVVPAVVPPPAVAPPAAASAASPPLAELPTVIAPAAEPVPTATADVESSKPLPVSPKEEGQYRLFSRGFGIDTQQVRIALAFKNADVQFVRAAGPKEDVPDWVKEGSPDNDGFAIMQFPDRTFSSSCVDILTSLETSLPVPSLHPTLSAEWTAYFRSELHPCFTNILIGSNDPVVQAKLRPQLNAAIAKIVAHLENSTRGGPYFLGADFSIADVVLAPILLRLPMLAYFTGIEYTQAALAEYTTILQSTACVSQTACTPTIDLQKSIRDAIPKGAPVSTILRLHHAAIRAQWDQCLATAVGISQGIVVGSGRGVAPAKELVGKFEGLVGLVEGHGEVVDTVVRGMVQRRGGVVPLSVDEERENALQALRKFAPEFLGMVKRIAGGEKKVAKEAEFKSMVDKLRQLSIEQRALPRVEDAELMPLLQELEKRQEEEVVIGVYGIFKQEGVMLVLESLDARGKAQYLGAFEKKIGAQKWMDCKILLSKKMMLAEWNDLTFRLPGMAL